MVVKCNDVKGDLILHTYSLRWEYPSEVVRHTSRSTEMPVNEFWTHQASRVPSINSALRTCGSDLIASKVFVVPVACELPISARLTEHPCLIAGEFGVHRGAPRVVPSASKRTRYSM